MTRGNSSRRKSKYDPASKYNPAHGEALVKFFDVPAYTEKTFTHTTTGLPVIQRVANDPPHLIDFARKIKVHISSLYHWEKQYPEFHAAFETARKLQEKFYLTAGFLGLSNAVITKLILMNNYGYREKTETNGTGAAAQGDTINHINITSIRVDASREELARDILTELSRRTPSPSDRS